MTTARRGPKRPASATLPPARARVAQTLAELGDGVLLADLAARLGGHPNATRAHLEALEADGQATCAPLPRSGPGRPALGWTLTAAGRRALAGDPTVAAYAQLVTAMADHLAQAPDAAEQARQIGCAWGIERAGTPSRAALLAILTDLGFDPQEGEDCVRLRTCPILDAASQHPGTVCAIHAGLVAGASGTDRFRLLPFAEPGACRIDWT